MNPGDRITIRVSHSTTIEFYRGTPRKYRIRDVDLPRLRHIFNSESWLAHTHIGPNGLVEIEFIVSDRELPEPDIVPEVEPALEFFSPDIDPDPLAPYWDFRDTMNDFVASTRN
jgi:hypothetical protein